MTPISADLSFLAPGSTVIIRDAEWLVTGMEAAGERWFLDVIGTSGLVREQTATFYTGIDHVAPLDPRHTKAKADTSARFTKSSADPFLPFWQAGQSLLPSPPGRSAQAPLPSLGD